MCGTNVQWETVQGDRTSYTKCPVAELKPCSGYDQTPRAAERRAERLETVKTGMHSSVLQDFLFEPFEATILLAEPRAVTQGFVLQYSKWTETSFSST